MKLLLAVFALASAMMAQSPAVTISAPSFTGSGLNDATSGGRFASSPSNHIYAVCVSSTGTPDNVTVAKDFGSAGTPFAMSTSFHALGDGVQMKWASTTGHTANDCWTVISTANGTTAVQSFVQTGVGGRVTRPAQDKMRDTLSALDFFGVDNSGLLDSAPGIQRAINEAIRTGRELYFPAGVYLCNAATGGVILNILANTNPQIAYALGYASGSVGDRIHGGLRIRGAGKGRTIIKTTNSSGDDLMAALASGGTSYFPHFSISDLSIEGPDIDSTGGTPICPYSGGTAGVSGNGLRVTGTTNGNFVEMSNVNIYYFCGSGKAALWLENAEETRINNVELRYSNLGFKVTNDFNASLINGLKLDSNYTGGHIEWAGSTVWNGLEVQSNCKNGLELVLVNGNKFNAPYFENNANGCGAGFHGLVASYMTDTEFDGGNWSTVHDDIYLDGTTVYAVAGGRPVANTRNRFRMGSPFAFQAGALVTINGSSWGNTWEGFLRAWFASDPTATETLINEVLAFGNADSNITTPTLDAKALKVNGIEIFPASPMVTLADGTTIIDCSLGTTQRTNNSTATTINFMSNCADGQEISVVIADANTSFATGVAGTGRLVLSGDVPSPIKATGGFYRLKYLSAFGISLMLPSNYTSGVTAGTYGDATHTSRITVDGQGHVSSASSVGISSSALSIPGGFINCSGSQHINQVSLASDGTLTATCTP